MVLCSSHVFGSLAKAQPQNWFHSISFCSTKYQYLVKILPIDVSIWISLSALIAMVCIICHKEFVSYFFFSVVAVVERGHQGLRKRMKKRGDCGLCSQKPEHFDARKRNGNLICDPPPYGVINEILTPPPPFRVGLFFSSPPKIAQPPSW